MKTFFLINSLGFGGAERVISNIYGDLSKKYDVEILCLKRENKYSSNLKVNYLLNHNSDFLMLLCFPIYIYKLRRLLKNNKGCKVISFLELSNFVNILVNKYAIISFRTNVSVFRGFKGKLYLFFIKKLYPKAKLIITNSLENTESLKKFLNKKEIITIKNPVSNMKFGKKITNFVGRRVFISVGRLDKNKRFDLLIDAFNEMSFKNDILLIIGSGAEETRLKRLAKDNVIFLGEKKNVFDYLKIANYFVFSSYAEGFPNVLLEANQVGIPIITSDFKTGAREIIDPNLGFDDVLNYPYKGPNGYLLGRHSFKSDFKKVFPLLKEDFNLKKLAGFNKSEVISAWVDVISK